MATKIATEKTSNHQKKMVQLVAGVVIVVVVVELHDYCDNRCHQYKNNCKSYKWAGIVSTALSRRLVASVGTICAIRHSSSGTRSMCNGLT